MTTPWAQGQLGQDCGDIFSQSMSQMTTGEIVAGLWIERAQKKVQGGVQEEGRPRCTGCLVMGLVMRSCQRPPRDCGVFQLGSYVLGLDQEAGTPVNYSTTGRRVWVPPLHLCTRLSLQLLHHRKASLGLPTAPAYMPLTATIPPQEGESGSPPLHLRTCHSPLHLRTCHSLQLFHHRKASLGPPHCTCVHATHCNYSTTGRQVWVSPLHLRTRHSLQLFHHRKASLGLPTAPAYTLLTATIPPQEGESGSPHCTCVHATHCNYSTTGRQVWVSPLHLRTRHSLQLFHHRKASLGPPTAPVYTSLTATTPPQEGESGSPHCTCVHATHCNYSTTGRRVWVPPTAPAYMPLPTAPAYMPLTATIPPQEGESGSPPLHLRTRHSLQLFHHRKASLGLPTAPAYTLLTATIPPQEGESGSPHCTCVLDPDNSAGDDCHAVLPCMTLVLYIFLRIFRG